MFRAKALSEAGFPSNPARSDYSEIVTIFYPDELVEPDTVNAIVEETSKDICRAPALLQKEY